MIYYSLEEFNRDIRLLACEIEKRITSLYGIPRGGIPVAIHLSNITGIPLIERLPDKPDKSILIVDDLIDSGKTRNKYTGYDFFCIHTKPHSPKDETVYSAHVVDDWINYWWEGGDCEPTTIEDNLTKILEMIGENPNRIGLRQTPTRVAKMYQEFFCGYQSDKMPKITVFPNGEDEIYYDQMLRDEGYFFSFCEHHMLPFFGQYYYGYIPDKTVIGASKIGRIIDYYSGKLQVAERLVNDVVNCINEICHPKGQVLVMNARHLCKEMRGLKKWNTPYEAIAVRGLFATNSNGCKDEFMSRLIGK